MTIKTLEKLVDLVKNQQKRLTKPTAKRSQWFSIYKFSVTLI